MSRLFAFIFLILFALASQCFGAPAKQWNSILLCSNQVLSAKLMYLPDASLADEDYMFVELDNHTDKILDVSQTWINLPGKRTDKSTGQFVLMGDMACGGFFSGKLPPGKTKAAQGGVFECGLANLGLPPKEGYYVEINASVEIQIANGISIPFSKNTANFDFNWHYPDNGEIEVMKTRLKQLVANPRYEFGYSYRLLSLIRVNELANVLSLDELLSTLGSRQNSVDGRDSIVSEIGRCFSNSPSVVAYYQNEFKNTVSPAWDDCLNPNFWSPQFVEPFVARYEQGKGTSTLRILAMHRTDWHSNTQYVARLSAALLKRQPILSQNVAELSKDDLCAWSSAVRDVGIIGNTNFLKQLEVCLDDKRAVPSCISKFDSRPRPLWTPRVCDCALGAILMMVDGDSWSAFQKAGIKGWRTKEDDYAAHDKIIADLKARLNLKN